MLAMPDPSTFEIVPWRGDDAPVARMFCDIRTLAGDPFDGDPRRRAAPQPRAGARARLHVLRRPRDRVLLLRVGHRSDPARQRRLLRPHPHRQGERAPRAARSSRSRRWASRWSTRSTRTVRASTRSTCATPTRLSMADNVMTFRMVVKRIASELGVHATFMPKPIEGAFGSGLHAHLSLFEGDVNAFHDPGDEAGLSKTGQALHRRAAAPRTRDHRDHQPDGELLQAPHRRVRGAHLHLVGAQQRVGPRAGAAPEARQRVEHPHRVPLARPGVQPVPRVRGDARGRDEGHRGGLRPARRGDEQHLRDDARGAVRRRASTSSRSRSPRRST